MVNCGSLYINTPEIRNNWNVFYRCRAHERQRDSANFGSAKKAIEFLVNLLIHYADRGEINTNMLRGKNTFGAFFSSHLTIWDRFIFLTTQPACNELHDLSTPEQRSTRFNSISSENDQSILFKNREKWFRIIKFLASDAFVCDTHHCVRDVLWCDLTSFYVRRIWIDSMRFGITNVFDFHVAHIQSTIVRRNDMHGASENSIWWLRIEIYAFDLISYALKIHSF